MNAASSGVGQSEADGYTNAFSKKSFVALLCFALTQTVTNTEDVFEYCKSRLNITDPGWNFAMIAIIQLSGCALMDFAPFAFDLRKFSISVYYAAGALFVAAGVAFFVQPEDSFTDVICVVAAYGWMCLVKYPMIRAVYDGAAKKHRPLWASLVVGVFFMTEFTSALFLGVFQNHKGNLLQVLFIVTGISALALATYLVTFKQYGTPAYKTADSKSKGWKFVRYLRKIRKTLKSTADASPSSNRTSFEEMVRALDPQLFRDIKMMTQVRYILTGCLLAGLIMTYPDYLAARQLEHTRQVFRLRYENVFTFVLAVPFLSIWTWSNRMKLPHTGVAAVALAILASFSHTAVQHWEIDPAEPMNERCKDYYVVVGNFRAEVLSVSSPMVSEKQSANHLIWPNSSKAFCSRIDTLSFGTETVGLSRSSKNGTFVLVYSNTFKTVLFKNTIVDDCLQIELFNLTNFNSRSEESSPTEKVFDQWPVSLISREGFPHKLDISDKEAGHYVVIQNGQNTNLVVLVPHHTVRMWVVFAPLILTSLSHILFYSVFFHGVFLTPLELGSSAFGLGYLCCAPGFIIPSIVLSGDLNALKVLAGTVVVTAIAILEVLLYWWKAAPVDVWVYQREEEEDNTTHTAEVLAGGVNGAGGPGLKMKK